MKVYTIGFTDFTHDGYFISNEKYYECQDYANVLKTDDVYEYKIVETSYNKVYSIMTRKIKPFCENINEKFIVSKVVVNKEYILAKSNLSIMKTKELKIDKETKIKQTTSYFHPFFDYPDLTFFYSKYLDDGIIVSRLYVDLIKVTLADGSKYFILEHINSFNDRLKRLGAYF